MIKLSNNNNSNTKKFIEREIKKELKKRITKIIKYFESPFTLQVVTSTPNIDQVFIPAQGLTDLNRIGDYSVMEDVEVNLSLQFPYAILNANNQIVRFVLFVWHEDSADVVPTAALLFNQSISSVYTNSAFNQDALRSKKFTIICDKTFTGGPYWQPTLSAKFKCHLNQKVGWTSSGTNGTNLLYSAWVGNESIAAYQPSATASILTHFTDPVK
jgi:hypothetical protein